tara:strand:+ start:206 stop:481 length:276 start_codon:yes stop_codon:yes gene_type:complete
MAQSPYKMKGTPMQRNFGVGEKESPAKVVGLAAAAIGAGISAAIGGGVSYKLSKDKEAADKKKQAELDRIAALDEASEAITNTGKEKDRLV